MKSDTSNSSLHWSKYSDGASDGRETGDPLGLRAAATQIARKLVPVFTQRTHRVRGFSLLVYGLERARAAKWDSPSQTERFLRFERLWVAAAWRQHEKSANRLFFPWAGRNGIQRSFVDDGTLDLTKPILSRQLSGGLWGGYRVAAGALDLVHVKNGRSTSPEKTSCTKRGGRLVEDFDSKMDGTSGWLTKLLSDEVASVDRFCAFAEKLGARASPEEALVVQDALHDVGAADAIQHLRKIYDESKGLTLDQVRDYRGALTPRQQRARKAAVALDAIAGAIEVPYRAWIADRDGEPAPTLRLDGLQWDDVDAELDGTVRARFRQLRQRLRSASAMSPVHEHHCALARGRGAPPWSRDDSDPTRANYTPPDYCLGALASLFDDGLYTSEQR